MVSEAASKEQEDGTSFRNFHTACLPDRKSLSKAASEIKTVSLCCNFFIIVSSENFKEMLSLVSFNILFLCKKLMYKKEI